MCSIDAIIKIALSSGAVYVVVRHFVNFNVGSAYSHACIILSAAAWHGDPEEQVPG